MVPTILKYGFNPENYSNYLFALEVAHEIPSNSIVLDAGAGSCPYAHLHREHNYITTDFGGDHTVRDAVNHDFFSDVSHLPMSNDSFDAVICYQVLEHVPYPAQVVAELYRNLRPGGWLYVTVPQGWGLHHEPYHFFNHTRYGLELLFKDAGFEHISIEERGGIFWLLSHRLNLLSYYILFQYLYPIIKPKKAKEIGLQTSLARNLLSFMFILPFYIIFWPLTTLVIPILFFVMDPFDQRRLYTLGYKCKCQKGSKG